MNIGIGVDEDAFSGRTLGAVAGDGVAVVEMTMLAGVECDVAVVVEADGHAAIGMDRLDDGHVPIRHAEHLVGCGELNPVAYGELAVDLLVNADACQAAGIVSGKFLVRLLERELVEAGLIATTYA